PGSCSFRPGGLPSGRRVKRSRALRGRNPTRDSSADGAPMALRTVAPNRAGGRGPFPGHRTPEPCLENPPSPGPRRHRPSLALLGLLVLHRLPEAKAFAVHLEDLTTVRKPIQEGGRHALALEHLAPFAERQVARDQQAAPLVAVGEHLE